jgi:hypothetical protein
MDSTVVVKFYFGDPTPSPLLSSHPLPLFPRLPFEWGPGLAPEIFLNYIRSQVTFSEFWVLN